MKIPLTEPTSTRLHFNPVTNRMHLLVSFIEGQDISTSNTCKVDERLKAFFDGDAVNELESYKSVLEFHISLLEEGDAVRQVKEARLSQINTYLEAVIVMRSDYMTVMSQFRSQPSNLYSIQLRPRVQDPYSKVVNPVFTMNRGNDWRGTPLSSLYNKMYEAFPKLSLERTDLTTKVLKSLPEGATFDDIKQALKQQCKEQFKTSNIDIDFDSYFKRIPGQESIKKIVKKAHVDETMGFDNDTTPGEYIDALLYLCAPNLWGLIPGSPFYLGTSSDKAVTTERLSIVTQFYLGVMNVHCRIKDISDKNFGEILDDSPTLSQELVGVVSQALTFGDDVEQAIVTFFNAHKDVFKLSRDLSTTNNNGIPSDKDAIQQKFDITYRTITATKENEHMDDFMLLDRVAHDENAPFVTHEGVIYTDFANIAPATDSNQSYFAEIRYEAAHHPELNTPQKGPVITVDIEPDALMDKLNDVQWETLPKEIVDACRALPIFKVRQLLDDVAKGKQNEANTILQASDDIQTLLRTSGKFTDYSGRTFNCTAYEYAYWAKDTHMRRMLESHMDNETKAELKEKIDEIERSGLVYQQHGVSYQNPHYDMSFSLKNLNLDDFRELQKIVGKNSVKLQQATAENYRNMPFTATEYEALKKALEQRKPTGIASFFYTWREEALSAKLQFDFHSLITALDSYVNNYGKWDYHHEVEAWMKVGKAQRDVPAHVAHEYCRLDRSFDLDAYKDASEPRFKEKTLPRDLTFDNNVTDVKSWFPLTSAYSGLGFDFGVFRVGLLGAPDGRRSCRRGIAGRLDLEAVRHLDEVRTADLIQSREILKRASLNSDLRLS